MLRDTHPAFDALYKLFLSLFLAQKNVSIRIVEGSSQCEILYAFADN